MNYSKRKAKKKVTFIQNSTLILVAFTTAFFARIIEAAGAPSLINFLHFIAVSFCFFIAIITTSTKDIKQIAITWKLLCGLLILLGVMFASALLNSAGAINVVVDFLMLGEPFLLLIAIICTPISAENLKKFRRWIIGFAFTNLVVAFIQWPLAFADILPRADMGREDSIQGVFYLSGAGNTVSTSVSMTFAGYYLVNAKTVPLLFRLCVMFGAVVQLIVSDSKQVIFAFSIAGIILWLINLKDIGKAIIYSIVLFGVIAAFLWCVEHLEAFLAFKQWMSRTELYESDGDVTLCKTSVFRIVPSYYHSGLNWLFGLGPGHTVSRLGGWMLKDYASLLQPLGATIHPASMDAWRAVYESLVAKGSTMFLPFFGWAGIWGDLGFLGLVAYLYLASIVWRNLCLDNFACFLVLTVFSFGLIFTQMEEPGYMLFIATILGLQWHEKRIQIP